MTSKVFGMKLLSIYLRKNLPKPNLPMYFTYILECADKTLYIGCTNDIERRLKQHNNSKRGAHYTKIRRPVVLKYKEKFETLGEARRREHEFKSWERKEKLKLIA